MEQHKNETSGAVLTAFLTAVATWISHVNWLTVLGTIVSCGWFAIGAVRFVWDWQDRKARRAAGAGR